MNRASSLSKAFGLALFACFLPAATHAADLAPGMSLDAAMPEIERLCEETGQVTVSPPVFPLAAEREIHVICRGWKTPDGTVERAAFVFADGELVAIEARGEAVAALAGDLADAPTYLHYTVFNDRRGLADTRSDAVWILGDGALHLNLFTWSNPLLAGSDVSLPAYDRSAAVPSLLDFEIDLEARLPGFHEECPLLEVSRDERVWLPNEPQSQTQVNCFGYEYAGFPRKLEAVYGDGRLQVVWILTGAGEEGRLPAALGEVFGDPLVVGDRWEVFDDGRVALRKDKPEVLLLSDEIAPLYRRELGLEGREPGSQR